MTSTFCRAATRDNWGKRGASTLYDKRATNELSWDETCRRAGGRRRYNRVRQFRANYRLTQVVKLLHQTGFRRGHQTKIAKALGVHRSTISRDLRRLHLRGLYGREADKMLRDEAFFAKRARDDARADREYELRKIAAARVEDTGPAAEDEHVRPPIHSTTQVARWLPVRHK